MPEDSLENNNETINASLSTFWDAALYLITDCANSATTRVAGSDNGNPEQVFYANISGSPQTYYLIVDSWQTGSQYEGDYTLDISFQ